MGRTMTDPGPPGYSGRKVFRCCLERHGRPEPYDRLPSGAQGTTTIMRRQDNRLLVVRKVVPHGKYIVDPSHRSLIDANIELCTENVDYFLEQEVEEKSVSRGSVCCSNINKNEPVEVKILRDFLPPHDNIMQLLDYSVGPHDVKFFYHFYAGGDLHDLIEDFLQEDYTIPELLIWQCYQQMASALACLHHGHGCSERQKKRWKPIIHRDIKPANILLKAPIIPGGKCNPTFVLADFGFASTMYDLEDRGTRDFQAPEPPPFTEKSDVYSLGATIHAMGHENDAPVVPAPAAIARDSILRDEFYQQPWNKCPRSFSGKYSLDLELLMFQALEHNPAERIDSLTLLKFVGKEFQKDGRARSLAR